MAGPNGARSLSFVVLILASVAWWYMRKPNIQPTQEESSPSWGSIPVIHMKPGDAFAQEAVANKTPVIFRDTFAMRWSALSSRPWNMSFICNADVPLVNARIGQERLFIAAQQRTGLMDTSLMPKSSMERKGASYTMRNVTSSRVCSGPKNEYVYYAGPLDYWPSALTQHIEPRHMIQLDDELSAANIWLGSKGVIANTHYDRSENFNIQLVGAKRWWIFPPSAWQQLYHYPSIHPSYHQSQVDFDSPSSRRDFPLFPSIKGYQVVVHPGDMLYVPPYWFHRVEALDEAVSLSVVSPSEEDIVWAMLHHLSLPSPLPPHDALDPIWPPEHVLQSAFEHGDGISDGTSLLISKYVESRFTSEIHTTIHAVTFLRRLVDALAARESPGSGGFVQEVLLNRRYRVIGPSMMKNTQHSSIRQVLAGTACNRKDHSKGDVSDAFHRDVSRALEVISRRIATIEKRPNYGIKAILLGNFVEEIGRRLVGADRVYHFLEVCLGDT